MTDWDAYCLGKPTDLSTLYPVTVEDRKFECVMRRVVQALTTLVALIGIWLAYATYPEWSWFFIRP